VNTPARRLLGLTLLLWLLSNCSFHF